MNSNIVDQCKEVLELSKSATLDKGPWHNCFPMFGDSGAWGVLSGITYHGSVVKDKSYNMISMPDCEYIASVNPQFIQELIPLFLEAVEVIGFYANERSWGGYHRDVDTIMDDSSKAKASDGFDINLGGRRAREFLKKVDSNE